MTAKSVLLRPRAHALTCPLATPLGVARNSQCGGCGGEPQPPEAIGTIFSLFCKYLALTTHSLQQWRS